MAEIEYKTENVENCGKQRFCDSKEKKSRKTLFLEHFLKKNSSFIISDLLIKLNKNFIVYLSVWCIGRPTQLISALSDIAFLKKHCAKSQKTLKITITETDFLENGKLASLFRLSTVVQYVFAVGLVRCCIYQRLGMMIDYCSPLGCPVGAVVKKVWTG